MKQEIQHTIDLYVAGKLSAEEIDALWASMLAEPEAYDYLITVATARDLANSDSQNTPASTTEIRPRTWKEYTPWFSAAAVLALIITVLLNIQIDTQQQLRPIGDINVGQFEIGETMRDAQNDQTSITVLDSMLAEGMQAKIDGREEDSRNTFMKVVEEFPNEARAAKAYLNLGILDYNDDDFESAIQNFGDAATYTDRTLIREKAFWFKANAHLHLNQIKEARQSVLKAYAQNGDYRREAFIMLKKLDAFLGNSDTESATKLR